MTCDKGTKSSVGGVFPFPFPVLGDPHWPVPGGPYIGHPTVHHDLR